MLTPDLSRHSEPSLVRSLNDHGARSPAPEELRFRIDALRLEIQNLHLANHRHVRDDLSPRVLLAKAARVASTVCRQRLRQLLEFPTSTGHGRWSGSRWKRWHGHTRRSTTNSWLDAVDRRDAVTTSLVSSNRERVC